MDELHDGRQLVKRGSHVATGTSGEQYEKRAQPLAASGYDVLGHLTDEDDFRVKTCADYRIHGLKV